MIIGIVILILLVLYLVGFFNGLRTTEVRINAAIQEIGNQLKRQSQLIPNLIESVKGYMKHEKNIFEDLTAARKMIDKAINSHDPGAIDQAQTMLTKTMGSLQVIAESNPQIMASSLINNMMNELRDTADKIMYARRTFIDLSADFNVKISTIPGIWLAPLMGFKKKTGLETPESKDITAVSESETKNPEVKLN
ncbi:MAG TPA: LemA family protein [Candidatus Woesebacteria bacterium]|nr:LemA family protein [Candidatus Woesebacteria bacterium]HPR99648.1 LemA family protein [Candidatus Woesebacteria bacterium]